MKFTLILATLLAALAPMSSSALDVKGYELLSQQSKEQNDRGIYTKALLQGYFSGVADQLNFMTSANMRPLLDGGLTTYCIPKTVKLTPEMLQALVDAELRNPERQRELLGADWKDYTVPGTLIYFALIRNYPCR